MKLHELSPAEGSKKSVKRIGRGLLQVKARQPAKDRRARNHVQATADVPF